MDQEYDSIPPYTYILEDIRCSDYPELSNFYQTSKSIKYHGKKYKTAEHLYQSLRYIFSDNPIDLKYAEIIRKSNTALHAKLLGEQKITNTISKYKQKINKKIKSMQKKGLSNFAVDHHDIKFMQIALYCKFTQDIHCKNVLLNTNGYFIYNRDKFWGKIYHQKILIGDNHYGVLLEELYNSIN